MGKALSALICACFLSGLAGGIAIAADLTDDELRSILIRDSIARYPGNCPCPYNTDRAGRRCGGRSAYSRPGGHAPLCYPQDVTKEMIERYRKGK